MEQVKLSIIIPCYNVAEFIPRCLDSVYDQDVDINSFEVISVIDGSPDESETICCRYASKFSNLKIIKIENSGVYKARNVGVENAKGKYVWFVDPDDYISPKSLSHILESITKENLDAISFFFNRIDEDGNPIENIKDNYKIEDINSRIMSGIDFLNGVMLYSTFLWGFVIKRSILESLKFNENMRSMGDAEYIPRMLLQVETIKLENFIAYNYVCREGSISKLKKPSINLLNGAFMALETNIKMKDKYPEIRYFKEFSSYLVLINIRLLSQSDNVEQRERFFSFIKKEKINSITYCGRDVKRKIMTILYNISPIICFIISKLFKRQ